ncbi:MAG TPA: hypothetical protein VH083_25595 [Myxococcales bacterium]|nr:hypothetical protein [Myxococcales bacterium]
MRLKAGEQANVAGALPPTWPAGVTLTAFSVQATSADLSWTAANDNGALAQYEIFDNGLVIKTLPASTLTAHLEGLAPNSSHVFHVEAGDSAGNWSTTGPSTTSIVLPHLVITPPPLATDVETNFVQQTLFIYTVVAGSPSPVQIGMTGGSIDPARVAVIRGVVFTRFGARDYDPLDEQGSAQVCGPFSKSYNYTHNDPINYIDPDGHNPIVVVVGVAAAVYVIYEIGSFVYELYKYADATNTAGDSVGVTQRKQELADQEMAKMMRGETFDPSVAEAVDQQPQKALGDIFDIGNNLPPGTSVKPLNGREFHKDLLCPEPKSTW